MFRGLYIEEHLNSGLKTCCKWKRTSKLRHRATFFKFWPSGQILTSSKKLLFQIQNQHQKLFRFMMVIKKFIFCCFGVINDPLHASPCILMCLACYDSQAFHWYHLFKIEIWGYEYQHFHNFPSATWSSGRASP